MNLTSKSLWFLALTGIVTSSLVALAAAPKKEAAFVSMFDGKTLDDWEATPARTAPAWTVQDGMIVGNGDKGRGYLTYARNKQVADLEMHFCYRFPGKGNSGVSIRAIKDDTGRRDFQSYHADIGHLGIGKNVMGAWDFHTPGRTEHRCFRGDRLVIDKDDQPQITAIENALTESDIHKGEWNQVRIIARGNNFKLYVNGKLSSEFTENIDPGKRLDKGMIQLQLHDPGMIVHFKDLKIKILK